MSFCLQDTTLRAPITALLGHTELSDGPLASSPLVPPLVNKMKHPWSVRGRTDHLPFLVSCPPEVYAHPARSATLPQARLQHLINLVDQPAFSLLSSTRNAKEKSVKPQSPRVERMHGAAPEGGHRPACRRKEGCRPLLLHPIASTLDIYTELSHVCRRPT